MSKDQTQYRKEIDAIAQQIPFPTVLMDGVPTDTNYGYIYRGEGTLLNFGCTVESAATQRPFYLYVNTESAEHERHVDTPQELKDLLQEFNFL